MISMPQAGIDASGNIYVVYSTVMENDTTGTSNSMNTPAGQPYRDLFMMYLKPDVTGNTYDSAFGGLYSSHSTWSFPVNITKTPGYEDAFPSMARNVDANAYITWQEDMEPGTNLINGDPCSVNYIKYMALDITQFQSDAAAATNGCQTTTLLAPNAAFDTASLASNRCTWTFTDISTPTPNSYSWTFPSDATPQTSTAKNPTVHFANGGNHIIKLDVYNQSGTSHAQKSVFVNAAGCVGSGINNILDAQSVNIYPNPSNGMLNVSFNNLNADHATITVENMLGQQIAAIEAQAIHTGSAFNFNIQNQAAGIYFVKISTEKGSLTQKVVLEK
jgi:PKD repeat protein